MESIGFDVLNPSPYSKNLQETSKLTILMILAHLLGLKELKLLAAPIGSETNLWPSPLQQGGNMASEVILSRVVPQHISRQENMQQANRFQRSVFRDPKPIQSVQKTI